MILQDLIQTLTAAQELGIKEKLSSTEYAGGEIYYTFQSFEDELGVFIRVETTKRRVDKVEISLKDRSKNRSIRLFDYKNGVHHPEILQKEMEWLHTGSWIYYIEQQMKQLQQNIQEELHVFDIRFRLPSVLS